jgi:ATP-dependent Clp protease ATP-binding subunit ClpA
MLERFTTEARQIVQRTQKEARELHHPVIGTEHLLLAMLQPDAGVAYTVLHEAGVTHEAIRAKVARLVGSGGILSREDAEALRSVGIDLDAVLARIAETFGQDALNPPPPPTRRGLLRRATTGRIGGHIPFSPKAKKALELALRETIRLHDKYIGSEHLLLGILRGGDGLAARALVDAGYNLDELRHRATDARLKAA